MFRRSAIGAVAVAALALTACGSSSKSSGGASAKSTAAPAKAGAASTAAPAKAGAASTAAPAKAGAASTAAPASGKPATGTPIVLGSVSSLTGANIFPEPPQAAKAVFDRLNSNGGINGHPIQFLVEDDGNNDEQTVTAAKRLVEDKKVVAMVGGGSITDCTSNAKYYAEKKMYSIAGANACVEAATVAPANTGPFLGIFMTLEYMFNDMGKKSVCFVGRNVGLTPIFRDQLLPVYEKITGHKLAALITSETNEDLTPAVTQASQKGCDGVLLAYTEPDYISYFQIANAQGQTGKVQYAMLTSGFSDNVLAKIKDQGGEGTIANSEFLPYSADNDKDPEMADFKALMKANKIGFTSFAQSGYVAANAMIEALKSVQGDYTVDSVGAAIQKVSYKTSFLGDPYKFVPFTPTQQPNMTSKIVQIKKGTFVTISDWQRWPPAKK